MSKSEWIVGPNQRRILRILENEPDLTVAEIASKLYDETVKVGSDEYAATSKSLTGLLNKKLIVRRESKVTWRLAKRKAEV